MTDLDRLDALAGALYDEVLEEQFAVAVSPDWYGGFLEGATRGIGAVRPDLVAAVRERDELREAAQAVVGPRPRQREWKSITRLRAALHREDGAST